MNNKQRKKARRRKIRIGKHLGTVKETIFLKKNKKNKWFYSWYSEENIKLYKTTWKRNKVLKVEINAF